MYVIGTASACSGVVAGAMGSPAANAGPVGSPAVGETAVGADGSPTAISVGAQFIGSLTSDSYERLALMNTSEEMGQARDTSTHVTLNALNSRSSPLILDSLLYCSMDARDEKKNLQMFG